MKRTIQNVVSDMREDNRVCLEHAQCRVMEIQEQALAIARDLTDKRVDMGKLAAIESAVRMLRHNFEQHSSRKRLMDELASVEP